MKVVICGAGIAGLALAWWLDRRGWDVVLVEAASGPRSSGYLVDFFGPGYEVADRMGVLPDLRAAGYDIEEARYVDRRGRRMSTANYRALSDGAGGRLISLMRGDLERALLERLGSASAPRFGTTVSDAVDLGDQVRVTLDDGTVEHADLLVGCDGIHSRVRELAFGPERQFLRHLGYHTAAYVFRDSEVRQRLGNSAAMLTRPGRLAGFYALRDGGVASFLVHRAGNPAKPVDPRAEVHRVYSGLGWVVDDALQHCPDPPLLYYDQVAQVEVDRWDRGRICLAGDACQAVSLLAGQGASLAMAGAYVLADELRAHSDVPGALARYTARFRPTATSAQATGRRMAEWVAPTTWWRIAVRDAALRLTALPGGHRLLNVAGDEGTDVLGPVREESSCP